MLGGMSTTSDTSRSIRSWQSWFTAICGLATWPILFCSASYLIKTGDGLGPGVAIYFFVVPFLALMNVVLLALGIGCLFRPLYLFGRIGASLTVLNSGCFICLTIIVYSRMFFFHK